jgi:phage terminase large subunit GpA-like protein
LSGEASAEPGQWRTSRAEYQREILDAITDPAVHTVVVQTSAQVGKSEALLNAIGFHVAQDPSPMLLVQPTLDMAEAFSKDRLAPMLRDTPALSGLVADPRSRDSGNTLLHKQFPGGHVTLAGANSPASLASRPVRVVLCDEVDRYPASAGTEGDPVTLAKARNKNFWNRKTVLTSTPTIKGFSRIEQAYEESDRRRFWVPCAHCSDPQPLEWKQVQWPQGKPQDAKYVCAHCGATWSDGERVSAIRRGEWRAERVFAGVAGFHLSELYSPWSTIADIAVAFVAAKESRSAERMRAWQNTCLGETWDEDGEALDDSGLMSRRKPWVAEPEGVLLRTCGIDVQDDRVEVETVGWGDGEESWSLAYRVIYGDPSAPTLWRDLEAYLLEQRAYAACIDSGGHFAQAVYAWAWKNRRLRVKAIKGMSGGNRLIWPKRATKVKGGQLFVIGVDQAKDVIFHRLKLTAAGAGYCHFPDDRDAQWFAGLTSEVKHTRFHRGVPIREWRRRPGIRNEPLDCRVYAYAALCSIGAVNWSALARQKKDRVPVEQPAPQEERAPEPPAVQPARRVRRGSFVRSW